MTSDEHSARALAFQATVLLEEAVLMVLREADHPLQLAEIAEAAGMLGNKTGGRKTNCLAQGVLDRLGEKGLVRAVSNRIRRWELAP